MRLVVAIALAAACYSPHPQAGAPCSAAAPNCPSGQMCVSEAAGYFCETHAIIDALLADGAVDARRPIDARSIDAPPPDAQAVFSYTATVAECINPAMPDPAKCRSIKGNDQLVADGSDATTMQPWDAFVRFDLDNAFAGRTIQSVHLVLTATSDPLASSNSSGAIWQVAMFDLASLSMTAPAKIGTSPVAPAQSSVTQLEVLTFSIPNSLVAANGSVYLGIITTSQDGVNYWNLDGTNPPRLVVTVH